VHPLELRRPEKVAYPKRFYEGLASSCVSDILLISRAWNFSAEPPSSRSIFVEHFGEMIDIGFLCFTLSLLLGMTLLTGVGEKRCRSSRIRHPIAAKIVKKSLSLNFLLKLNDSGCCRCALLGRPNLYDDCIRYSPRLATDR
jgi:hypothetical protein